LEKNAKLVAAGKPGFLVNTLYPEMGEGWGVDDGFGYRTGRTYPNGAEEVHTYIAYYNHYGLWHGHKQNPGVLSSALWKLRDAYLLTGDPAYGRAGAILLYRIARFYPEYDLLPYRKFYNSHANSYNGKVIGRIWETQFARNLVLSYDAFKPMYSDADLLEFINARRAADAPPVNPPAIQQTLRDNILREVARSVKAGKIAGNFGMHQSAMALAAVVLDEMPESKEWIDWIFQPGVVTNNSVTGGNVFHQLIGLVSRDGHGSEVSPGYNRIWLSQTRLIADALAGYKSYPQADLYKHPKFQKMFHALPQLTLARRDTAQIGDSGATAGGGLIGHQGDNSVGIADFVAGFDRIRDPEIARWIHFANGNTSEGIHLDIFTAGAGKIADDIGKVIESKGPIDLDESIQQPAYGFSILRAGTRDQNAADIQRAFWMYHGRTVQHGHRDALNLGMIAFGLDFAPDLGYPETAGREPNRMQWVNATLSHNTVVVNNRTQDGLITNGFPINFHGDGPVKTMQADAQRVYPETSVYRRTVVMVDVDPGISYGVDFFHVRGGHDHLYSFHSQADSASVEAIDLIRQESGSYAGENVPWGANDAFPQGYSWLRNVRSSRKPETNRVVVNFKVEDFRKVLPSKRNLNLRLTMLEDSDFSEVTLAEGLPPRSNVNADIPKLEYLLVRRATESPGANLESLFSTVIEPYEAGPYLDRIEMASVQPASAGVSQTEPARALRISHRDGRLDYVIYASDNRTEFRIDDRFAFRGNIGVIALRGDAVVYSYVINGDRIVDQSYPFPALTGTVVAFTKELTAENSLTVRIEQSFPVEDLVGRFIHINNDRIENAAYQILGASPSEDGSVRLDLGNNTLIRDYASPKSIHKGYTYNVQIGQSFSIPLAYESGTLQQATQTPSHHD